MINPPYDQNLPQEAQEANEGWPGSQLSVSLIVLTNSLCELLRRAGDFDNTPEFAEYVLANLIINNHLQGHLHAVLKAIDQMNEADFHELSANYLHTTPVAIHRVYKKILGFCLAEKRRKDREKAEESPFAEFAIFNTETEPPDIASRRLVTPPAPPLPSPAEVAKKAFQGIFSGPKKNQQKMFNIPTGPPKGYKRMEFHNPFNPDLEPEIKD